MIKVFDERITMKDKDNYASVYSTVDKLDEMLNAHNIPHAFVLPLAEEIERNPEYTMCLMYETENSMEVSLIYALFCKLYRGLENENIATALSKIANRYKKEEI